MALPCPPNFDPTKPPPEPPLPSLEFLGKTCKSAGGAAINNDSIGARCVSYALVLPWETFKAEAKEAPGSNLYWRKRVAANVADPVIARAFQYAAAISKRHFAYYFGPGREHGSMKMADVLTKYAKELKHSFGAVTAEKTPKPTETAADFVKRGGYLLWIDGWGGGVFGHKDGRPGTALDQKRPSWVPDDIHAFQFYLDDYDVPSQRITLVVRLEYQNMNLGVVVGKINQAGQYVLKQACKGIRSDKMNQALTFASVYYGTPQAAAITALWKKQADACGLAFDPKPCIPSGAPAVTPGTTPAASSYPAGSMAWFDSNAHVYRIAVPNGSAAAPTHTEVAQLAVPPVGVPVVSRSTWERATRPFFARRTTLIGGGIGLFALLGTGAAVVITRR